MNQLTPAPSGMYQVNKALYLHRLRRSVVALWLPAVLLAASSCAGSHGSLSQKTRWYKHHSGGQAIPCPCGH